MTSAVVYRCDGCGLQTTASGTDLSKWRRLDIETYVAATNKKDMVSNVDLCPACLRKHAVARLPGLHKARVA